MLKRVFREERLERNPMETLVKENDKMMGMYSEQENVEGQMNIDFAKRMEMAVVNTHFNQEEEHSIENQSGQRYRQVE